MPSWGMLRLLDSTNEVQMKRKVKAWYLRLLAPDKKTLAAIGEDLRKLGITAASVGVVGLAVAGDTIKSNEAGWILA